jgi:hypothetical protein
MATVNHYFQSGIPMGRASEQNLYEDLIIECLQIYGFEVYYIPRTSFNEDRILVEDPLNHYENAYPIEMYLENTNGFEGEGDLLTRFGVELRETASFIVSRRRWDKEVGSKGQTVLAARPAEGDVLYFPLTKSYFEIRKVDGDTPFYQVGKLYIFRMQCELMQFSSEAFNTGVDEIDTYTDSIDQNLNNFEFLMEDGDPMLLEYTTDTPLLLESFSITTVDAAARNEDFDTNIEEILDFTEKNPFGEVFK